MRFNIAIMALVAVGCDPSQVDEGMGHALDGHVDESPQDGGIIQDSGPMVDAADTTDGSSTSDADGASDERDSGHSALDAAVGDDASEPADPDAGAGMCTGELGEPVTFGTALEPIELTAGDVTFEGQIDWRGRAFARITGVTPGTRYVLTASAASELVLSVFPDDTTFTDATCVSGDEVTERERLCIVTATGESIDVTIDARHVSDTFALTIKPAYLSEGTAGSPVQLATSALPYDLEVNSDSSNFYLITDLTPGQPYVVSARAAADVVHLQVYEGGVLTASPSDQQRRMHARAIGKPLDTSLLVAVRAWGPGTTAELDVRPATRASHGTNDAPIEITAGALPFEGEVGWGYNAPLLPTPRAGSATSFYVITGLTPGAYVVSLEDATAPVVLLVGPPSGSRPFAQADEDRSARLATRISGSTLQVTVINQGGEGTAFTLALEPSSLTSVGSQSTPLEVPLAALPYSGEVEPGIDSYYEITGLTPGQRYVARLTDVNEAPVGVLFLDGAGGQPCEVQASSGSVGLDCTVVPTETTARFQARVMGNATGGIFTLSLEPPIESGGSREQPVVIDCSSGAYTDRTGPSGEGYYEITGLTPEVSYLVEATLSDSDNDLAMYVFSGAADPPFSDSNACMSNGYSGLYPARCVSTSADGSLFVEFMGYASGRTIELSWRPSTTGSEGTENAPIALMLADLPYSGQVSGSQPSFYAISDFTPGTAYVVRVTPVEEILDVLLYFENAHESSVGPVFPGEPFVREFTATDTTGFIEIALPIGADGSSTFDLDVSPL